MPKKKYGQKLKLGGTNPTIKVWRCRAGSTIKTII
jgi:hypothetical protein